MDAKKMGRFLKELRKEKGLTQEQLAETLFVSGRTVSRWETGTNMPDLSILVQMAEFYEVEVKEILDGERKNGMMDQEWKETLSKVADYNKLEKEQAAKAGNIAFGLTFLVCAAAIVIQLIMTGDLLISVVCSGVFTAALVLCYIRLGASPSQVVNAAAFFFVGIAAVGFGVLRILVYCNRKRKVS